MGFIAIEGTLNRIYGKLESHVTRIVFDCHYSTTPYSPVTDPIRCFGRR